MDSLDNLSTLQTVMGRADHGPVMDQKCKVQIDEETLHPDLSTEYMLGQEALKTCCLLCQTGFG